MVLCYLSGKKIDPVIVRARYPPVSPCGVLHDTSLKRGFAISIPEERQLAGLSRNLP
jgi:hypothetical protein